VEGAWDLLRRIATLWHSDHLTPVNFIQVDDTTSAANVLQLSLLMQALHSALHSLLCISTTTVSHNHATI
jgi:hypothetical protein